MGNGLINLAGRFLLARKLRTAMGALSVALGVGLLVALLTLNATMDQALDDQIARQFGTYELMAGYRKPGLRFSAPDIIEIGKMPGVQAVAGILIPFYLEDMPLPRGLNYYGVPDTPLGRQFMPLGAGAWPGPGEVLVSEAWARREGLQVGDSTTLAFGPGGEQQVRISGLLATHKRLGVGIGVFDRTWLEAVTNRSGSTFALIDLQDGMPVHSAINAIQERFPDGEVDQRKFLDELRKNMNALRPVGLGMGLAALLASAFLLTGAFRMSLAECTRELATLRAIAATPGQVRRLILAEGLFLGLAGAAIGLLLGALGAAGSAGAVARLLAVDGYTPVFPWGAMVVAGAGGVVLALLSALGVARSASRTEPLRAMRPDLPAQEEGARTGGRFGLALAGLGAVALAVFPWLPDAAPLDYLPPLVGSTGGLAVAVGLLLGVQRLLPLLLPVLSAPVRGTAAGAVAVRSLLRHRRRSGLTVGAMGLGMILVVAIATIGWSLVGRWTEDIRRQHPAEIQLEVPSLVYQGVTADLADRVAAIPGVTRVAAVGTAQQAILVDWDFSKADPEWLKEIDEFNSRFRPATGMHQRQSISPTPATLPELVAMGAYRVVQGSLAAGFGEGQIALDAEYARQRGIKLGDRLKLNVRQSIPRKALAEPDIRAFTVVALLEADTWRMPRVVVSAPLPGGSDRLRIVYANAAPEQLEAAREQARELVASMAFSTAEYSDQESALAQLRLELNQRFALLVAVALVMAAVAVMSLVGAMVSSVSERRREFALLRSVGATPQQVRNMVLIEGGLLGLVGALVGITGGAVLGTAALTGLDLPLSEVRLPWPVMGAGLGLGLLLALLAALGPARSVMGAAPADAVRYE